MQEVVVYHNVSIVVLCVSEVSLAVIFVDAIHIVEEMSLNTLLLSDFIQDVRVLEAVREHHTNCRVPVNLGLISDSILSEGLFGEVHDLLRSSSTFHWHLRKHEYSLPALE